MAFPNLPADFRELQNINDQLLQGSQSGQAWFGKIYLGFPSNALAIPANLQRVNQRKRKVKHEIPGRDGDIVDDTGSPSRIVRMTGHVSPEILSQQRLAKTFTPVNVGMPLNVFISIFNNWWLSGLPVPLLSDPIQSFFVFEELDWIQWGGKANVVGFEVLLVERLPFSLSSWKGIGLTQIFMGAGAGLAQIPGV